MVAATAGGGKRSTLLVGAARVAAADPERAERLAMVRTMEMIVRESSGGATPTTLGTAVLEAMRRVPRHAFVPAARCNLADANRPRAKTTPWVSTCRKAGRTPPGPRWFLRMRFEAELERLLQPRSAQADRAAIGRGRPAAARAAGVANRVQAAEDGARPIMFYSRGGICW